MKSLIVVCITVVITFTFSASAKAQDTTSKMTDTVKTITIHVNGITCGGDMPIINKNVIKVKGVISCEVVGKPGATTTFKVEYNPNLITVKEIVKAVENSPSCDYPDQRPYRVKEWE